MQKQPGSEVESSPADVPALPVAEPYHPDNGNGGISIQRQLAAVHLEAHPLDQLAACLQTCLVTNE